MREMVGAYSQINDHYGNVVSSDSHPQYLQYSSLRVSTLCQQTLNSSPYTDVHAV